MERIALPERPDWREDAKACGFAFHTIGGERYWDERHAYRFSLAQIEDGIEAPSNALVQMCGRAAERIIGDDALMRRMAIPEEFFAAVRQSWERQEASLYGRFDFCWHGQGPARLLEFNADTPTSLFEAAVFQWRWLEDMKRRGLLPQEADQFNLLHEKLIEALGQMGRTTVGFSGLLHLACVRASEEDCGTIEYLADCARQAGLEPVLMDMGDIGVDETGKGEQHFIDARGQRIDILFKLYPLEDMVREDFGPQLIRTRTQLLEPLWKLVLSNKGLLPVLWQMHEGHPNLLPAWFGDEDTWRLPASGYVKKPLLSREGANVLLVDASLPGGRLEVPGPYGEEGHVIQQFARLPRFGHDWAVIGSWIVAGEAVGIGIREDDGPITRDSARFVPHFILD